MSAVAMGTRYSHFTLDERCRLRGLMELGLSAAEIARRLGRHRGTIYREIARNRCAAEYRPDSADRIAWVRKLRGPRKTRLTDYDDADIDDIVWMLNSTPRKCLSFHTPIEAFASQLGVALEL